MGLHSDSDFQNTQTIAESKSREKTTENLEEEARKIKVNNKGTKADPNGQQINKVSGHGLSQNREKAHSTIIQIKKSNKLWDRNIQRVKTGQWNIPGKTHIKINEGDTRIRQPDKFHGKNTEKPKSQILQKKNP